MKKIALFLLLFSTLSYSAEIKITAPGITKATADTLYAPIGTLGGGDNLGNHIATKTLDMASFPIIGAGNIIATSAIIGNPPFSPIADYKLKVITSSNSMDGILILNTNTSPTAMTSLALSNGFAGLSLNVTSTNSITSPPNIAFLSGSPELAGFVIVVPSTGPIAFMVNDGQEVGRFADTGLSISTLCLNSDCKSAWPAGGSGDNLGNHIATTTLQMGGYDIATSSGISGLAQIVWADGTVQVSSPVAGGTGAGDNLGNHIATTSLQMGAYSIESSSSVNANAFNSATIYSINGYQMLASPVTPSNVAIGMDSQHVGGGNENLTMGYNSGYWNSSGMRNVFIGSVAGQDNINGSDNIYLGYYAGYSNQYGSFNVNIGANAGYNNLVSENIFMGNYAGYHNTTGTGNTFIGDYAAGLNRIGENNSLIGYMVGYSLGNGACPFCTTRDSNNTILGYKAGYLLGNTVDNDGQSSNNTLIGYEAGYNIDKGTGNIVIGYGQDTSGADVNNELNIGGAITGSMVAGDTITFTTYLVALGFTDASPYPDTIEEAYKAIKSMKGDGYGHIDHSALDKSLQTSYTRKRLTGHKKVTNSFKTMEKGKEVTKEETVDVPVYTVDKLVGRNVSQTLSDHNKAIQDLLARIEKLEKK